MTSSPDFLMSQNGQTSCSPFVWIAKGKSLSCSTILPAPPRCKPNAARPIILPSVGDWFLSKFQASRAVHEPKDLFWKPEFQHQSLLPGTSDWFVAVEPLRTPLVTGLLSPSYSRFPYKLRPFNTNWANHQPSVINHNYHFSFLCTKLLVHFQFKIYCTLLFCHGIIFYISSCWMKTLFETPKT